MQQFQCTRSVSAWASYVSKQGFGVEETLWSPKGSDPELLQGTFPIKRMGKPGNHNRAESDKAELQRGSWLSTGEQERRAEFQRGSSVLVKKKYSRGFSIAFHTLSLVTVAVGFLD